MNHQEVIRVLKRNRDKQNYITVSITNVNQAGTVRAMKIGIVYKGQFVNITHDVARITDGKISHRGELKVTGYGEDMIFRALLHLYSALGYKQPHHLNAVQWYNKF